MAQNKIYKWATIDQLTAFLNGAVFSSKGTPTVGGGGGGSIAPQLPVGWSGLVGKTLTLAAPGPTGSCTFVASNTGTGSGVAPGTNPDPYTLLLKDIKAQIEAAITGVTVSMATGVLQIIETTPSKGVTVSSAGSANSALGFDTNANTVGKLYTPVEISATAPCWVWSDTDNNGQNIIYCWE